MSLFLGRHLLSCHSFLSIVRLRWQDPCLSKCTNRTCRNLLSAALKSSQHLSLHKDIHEQGKGVAVCDIAVCLFGNQDHLLECRWDRSKRKNFHCIFHHPSRKRRVALLKPKLNTMSQQFLRSAEVISICLYDYDSSSSCAFVLFVILNNAESSPAHIPALPFSFCNYLTFQSKGYLTMSKVVATHSQNWSFRLGQPKHLYQT